MYKKFCDRCGAVICGTDIDLDQDREYTDCLFKLSRVKTLEYLSFPIELDLCKSCQEDLSKWFFARLDVDPQPEKRIETRFNVDPQPDKRSETRFNVDPQPGKRSEKKLWRLFRKTHDKS